MTRQISRRWRRFLWGAGITAVAVIGASYIICSRDKEDAQPKAPTTQAVKPYETQTELAVPVGETLDTTINGNHYHVHDNFAPVTIYDNSTVEQCPDTIIAPCEEKKPAKPYKPTPKAKQKPPVNEVIVTEVDSSAIKRVQYLESLLKEAVEENLGLRKDTARMSTTYNNDCNRTLNLGANYFEPDSCGYQK